MPHFQSSNLPPPCTHLPPYLNMQYNSVKAHIHQYRQDREIQQLLVYDRSTLLHCLALKHEGLYQADCPILAIL